MIIDFKIKNFNSFKETSILDLKKKSKEVTGKAFITNKNNLELLNVLALVGVNGAGKSSLLEGLYFMKLMVLNSHTHNIDTNIRYTPFVDNKKPIVFEITFISEGKKYLYGFSYTDKSIIEEYAYIFNPSKSKIFIRNENSLDEERFDFGRTYKSELKKKSDDVISKTLMLSRAVQLNSETLKPIYNFFNRIYPINVLFAKPMDFSLLKDPKFKEHLLDNISFADFSIEDLELVKNTIKNINLVLSKDNSTVKQDMAEQEIEDLILIHKHNNKPLKLNFNSESSGTKKFILLFYNLLKISKDSIVLYDEIENSLNIEIVEFIINYFAKDKNNSQLIFTTHQPEILNYLRSDQIKIIEKKNSISTILELYDIVKSNDKINKNYGDYYKEGVLGGFPNVYKEY